MSKLKNIRQEKVIQFEKLTCDDMPKNQKDIHQLLASIFNKEVDESQEEIIKLVDSHNCESKSELHITNKVENNAKVKKLPEVLEEKCDVNSNTFMDFDFMEEQTITDKIIEFRKLEIQKQIEIFKFNIELYQNLCVHIKVLQSRSTMLIQKEKLTILIKLKNEARDYLIRFLLSTDFLLPCLKNYILLEEKYRDMKLKKQAD